VVRQETRQGKLTGGTIPRVFQRVALVNLLAVVSLALSAITAEAASDLSTVATPTQGSNEPTFFASQHRMVKTAGGRLLVVYGRHASGVQLAWQDRGGAWQTNTTGAVLNGQLLKGTGTGDWPASIAIAGDSRGRQHAWVVWGRHTFTNVSGVGMRRLSNLDSPLGPRVGRAVRVETAGLGTALVDIGFESSRTGRRGVIVWTRRTGTSSWAIQTKWFGNLDTDAPRFGSRRTLLSGIGRSRGGSLIPSRFGMRLAVRDNSRNPGQPTGKLRFFGHNLGAPLFRWWSGTPGVSLPSSPAPSTDARVAGVALSSGRLAATAESDTVNHVVTVQLFSRVGRYPTTTLTTGPGYTQPVLATNGTNLYLVMIKVSDHSVVSRKYAGGTWSADQEEISSADCGGTCSWPNAIRGTGTDRNLRFVVRGPNGGPTRYAVLAFRRTI
jgi:hypothetical protein